MGARGEMGAREQEGSERGVRGSEGSEGSERGVRGSKGSKGSEGSERGARGSEGSKTNVTLGFKAPTTIAGKKFGDDVDVCPHHLELESPPNVHSHSHKRPS